MKGIKRTPESRFEDLKDYPFQSRYREVQEGLNMHYLDEGPKDGPCVLLLHGEPSWSYLYRKMIPELTGRGYRCIAPDLIGFGKSDKPLRQEDYSYQAHFNWLSTLLAKLQLKDIILFCQDWGGLLGLRIVADQPELFSMVIASNTFLPTGEFAANESFLKWRAFSQSSPKFDIGKVIDMGTVQDLSPEVISAYNAPFPSEEFKAGARVFPMLVPIEKDDPQAEANRAAWKVLAQWKKPFLTVFGTGDPIMRGVEKIFQKLVPGTQGQEHKLLDAGHFIQEEKGEELAEIIDAFYRKNA